MTYKINYDQETTLVLGKYPSKLYENAPEPNIEISDVEYKRIFGNGLFQEPCVIDGVIKEYKKPDAELLAQAKLDKIAQLNTNRSDYCLKPILYNGNYYATTSNAQIAITYHISSLNDDASALYRNYPEDDNILLNREDFLNIASLIEGKEMSSRDLRKTRTDEINAIEITPEVTYEQAMEALNNIDITF